MLCEIRNDKVDRTKILRVVFFSGVAAPWRKTVADVFEDMHAFRAKLNTNTRFSLTIMQPIFNLVYLSGNHLSFLISYTEGEVQQSFLRNWCDTATKVMDSEPTTVCRSEEFNLGDHKKVHWAYNLEEIVFFTPHSFECHERKSNTGHSVLKRLKIKARALKNSDICDDILQKILEIFERLGGKISGNSAQLHITDLKDLDRYWDELFEVYGVQA